MKILVTGANGYLGQGVVRELLKMGNEIIATDRSLTNVDSRAVKIEKDLFNVEDPYKEFLEPDVVVHMAWRNGFVHNADSHMEDLPKHYSFLKKILESNVKQLTVMGSMHEIGFYEGSINEDTRCNPMSMYGISKNALRESTELLAKNNKKMLQWLRGFYIVGNSEYGSSIFSKIVQATKKGEKEFPFTNGQSQYDFLDYDDFCKQVAYVVNQNKVNDIINICSGYPEKLADRVERFIKENGFDIRLQYGAYPDRIYDSKAIWGDNKKIKEIMSEEKL